MVCFVPIFCENIGVYFLYFVKISEFTSDKIANYRSLRLRNLQIIRVCVGSHKIFFAVITLFSWTFLLFK